MRCDRQEPKRCCLTLTESSGDLREMLDKPPSERLCDGYHVAEIAMKSLSFEE
jgi:hypothetical protein